MVALGAWLWTKGEPSTEVPVITADATPEKVKPAEEGGLQVQNQDVQVLDPSTQTQAETVMPEPEQPITPPAAADAPAAEQAPTVVENTDEQRRADGRSTGGRCRAFAGRAARRNAASGDGGERDDRSRTGSAGCGRPGADADRRGAGRDRAGSGDHRRDDPSAGRHAGTGAALPPSPSRRRPLSPNRPQPAQAAQPEQPAAQEAPAQQAAVTPVAPTGNTRVQLAAGKSEATVQKEWAALQKAHPDLLGPLSLHIERVDKGASGIFYRLQAGPLADKTAAKELCASLKQKGQDCLVVAK